MDPMEVIKKAREGMNLRTVFGEPVTHGDLLIIPVAKIIGGAGGGSGEGSSDLQASGAGAGFGIRSAPVGVFVVKDRNVTWHPAIDRNAVILSGQLVGVVALVIIGSIIRAALRGRASFFS